MESKIKKGEKEMKKEKGTKVVRILVDGKPYGATYKSDAEARVAVRMLEEDKGIQPEMITIETEEVKTMNEKKGNAKVADEKEGRVVSLGSIFDVLIDIRDLLAIQEITKAGIAKAKDVAENPLFNPGQDQVTVSKEEAKAKAKAKKEAKAQKRANLLAGHPHTQDALNKMKPGELRMLGAELGIKTFGVPLVDVCRNIEVESKKARRADQTKKADAEFDARLEETEKAKADKAKADKKAAADEKVEAAKAGRIENIRRAEEAAKAKADKAAKVKASEKAKADKKAAEKAHTKAVADAKCAEKVRVEKANKAKADKVAKKAEKDEAAKAEKVTKADEKAAARNTKKDREDIVKGAKEVTKTSKKAAAYKEKGGRTRRI